MTEDQKERLVVAWESIAQGLGAINEAVRSAISKQWPEAKERREAIISRVPTAEDKIKQQTGNTDGPVDEWLSEFDAQEELGPREKEWLAGQAKQSSGTKATPKARRPRTTGA